MSLIRLLLLFLCTLTVQLCSAQSDSVLQTIQNLQQIPVKYINKIDDKIDKYSSRITSKTEKTLAKLSRWENKIQVILQKVNPEAAQRLFGNNQTFSSVLQKLKEGKAIAETYKVKYDEYRDKLTTSIKYLEQQKDKLKTNVAEPLAKATKKINELEQDIKNTEAVEQFIKERKKQLIDEATKYIGNSKYLTKIDKEAYYYVQTLRNYKEIFNDKKKAEELALKLLNKIPAFQKFTQQNSLLASLFRQPTNNGTLQSLAGLQSRTNVQALIQDRITAGGPNAQQLIRDNLQAAQGQLTELKNKVLKAGGNSSEMEIPNFKPNQQKTKTFKQRLEYGSNFQVGKSNSLMPSTIDIALSIGYKLNDKSLIGIGASYKMGIGSIQHLSISHQGIGIRSFIDWKLKKQFFVTGGFEMNYNAGYKKIEQLKAFNDWQQAGLIGISKKINIKTKLIKGTKLQLLYDVLARQHIPVSQPIIFRVGYQL